MSILGFLYLETFSEIYNKDLVIVTPDSHPDKLSIEAFQYLKKRRKNILARSLRSLAEAWLWFLVGGEELTFP